MPKQAFARFDLDAFCTLDRRRLLKGLAAASLVAAGGFAGRESRAEAPSSAYPFPLGVASGDPAADGFVIWTKLAPAPLARGGGMPNTLVEVEWAIAADPGMRTIIRRGAASAFPELGHAVHVEVEGLEPARDYHYTFFYRGAQSRVGRARTLPAPGAPVERLRFGLVGCQRYDDGYFTAFRHVAAENFDFVFHYGDYIYEYATVRPNERRRPVVRVMPDEPDETYTLDDYRHRYALYKLDPDLQAAHASAPFVMSYDDHEVANNWAGDVPDRFAPAELFLLRRAAAFQAWYEHMPVRRALLPRGPDILAYRRFAVGDLMTLNVLDTRQYRSDQPCGDGVRVDCDSARNPDRTMLGTAQETWLYDGFKDASAHWNVLGQQVLMMHTDLDPEPDAFGAHMDKWDGAAAARSRLFAAIEAAKLRNPVVLTGDIHRNFAGELRKTFDDATSAVGVELVGTSIASDGDGYDINARYRKLLAQNPHLKFFNGQRGYVRHTVTRQRWQADFQVLDKVSTRDGTLSTRKSLVVESGKPTLVEA
jgi:alkaline phosphatase D